MNWVNLKLHASGQYMLEALCSRLSYDINRSTGCPKTFDGPPEKWRPSRSSYSASTRGQSRQSVGSSTTTTAKTDLQIIELRAREHDVYVNFANRTYLSQTITFVPAESKWQIAAGGLDSTTVSDVREVSQLILSTHLFPPEID